MSGRRKASPYYLVAGHGCAALEQSRTAAAHIAPPSAVHYGVRGIIAAPNASCQRCKMEFESFFTQDRPVSLAKGDCAACRTTG